MLTVVVAASEVLPFVPEPVIGLCVSVTTSENVKWVPLGPPGGAVKVGFCAVGLESVTVGPPVCVQA